MRHAITPRHRAQRGFTLVELMVSAAIGLFIVAAVGGIYFSSKRTFWSTNAIASMDDTARTVFDLMGTSIRQADFTGCRRLGGTTNGDTRSIAATQWWNDVTIPVRAYVAPDPALNFTAPAPTPVAGTQVLTLISADPAREASVVADNPATGVITTGVHGFSNGQTLLATDCMLNSFFIMTGGAGGNTIAHDLSGNCDIALDFTCGSEATPNGRQLTQGATILPVVATAWYVAPSGNAANKGRSLWRASTDNSPANPASAELVNGVESMAFDLGVEDTAGNGSVNRWLPPGSVTNWGQVLAVRVHLLLSTLPDSATSAVGTNTSTSITFPANSTTVLTAKTTPAIDPNRVYREYSAVFAIRNRMN